MLPLESPRWRDLDTWPEPRALPDLLRDWRGVVEMPEAWPIWRTIYAAVVHQYTVKAAAYAVVPYAASELRRVPRQRLLAYLLDLGFIEAGRLSPNGPTMPVDLAEAYHAAVGEARTMACECLATGLSKPNFLYLISCVSNLFGHPALGRMLWHLDAIDPEEIEASGYCDDGGA